MSPAPPIHPPTSGPSTPAARVSGQGCQGPQTLSPGHCAQEGRGNNGHHIVRPAIGEHRGGREVIREDFQEEVTCESHRLSRSELGGEEG